MLIRPFRPSDAAGLAVLFHASVRQGGICDYSIEQVMAWSPSRPDPDEYLQRAESMNILVAENDKGQPIGYGDISADGYIDHLYCHPDAIGVGVGSMLYIALEAVARKNGVRCLSVDASEAARRLLERRGFIVDARRDFVINGVAIHNYRMSKLMCDALD